MVAWRKRAFAHLRGVCDFDPVGQISERPVQPLAEKYSASVFAQITFLSAAVPSHRGLID
jgi:hypothetical protein